jgi:hypothetical protein
MTPFASPEEVPQPLPTFDHRVEAAYRLLRAAQDSAKAAGRPSWEFAVEIEELRALGLSSTDLRSLLCAGYVLHGVERYDPGSRLRIFRHFTSLALPKGSCFVLTEKGLQGFGHPPAPGPLPAAARGPGVSRKDQSVGDRPCWDGALRELRWGGRLVKRFRVPAMNQEAILAALEEEATRSIRCFASVAMAQVREYCGF